MEPGKGYGDYVRLIDIVNKGILKYKKQTYVFKDNKIYIGNKPIQGLKVIPPSAYLKAVHFTSWENATQIRSTQRFEPSLDDPFTYFSEPGKMHKWPEKLIKKELGAASANTEVIATLVLLLENVWVKATREVVHFAIPGIILPENIVNLKIQKRKS